MSKASLAALARELPDGDFAGFEGLTTAQAQTIADAFRELRQTQQEALDRAIDHSLRYVPGPLRGVARLVLFGQGQP